MGLGCQRDFKSGNRKSPQQFLLSQSKLIFGAIFEPAYKILNFRNCHFKKITVLYHVLISHLELDPVSLVVYHINLKIT